MLFLPQNGHFFAVYAFRSVPTDSGYATEK